MCMGLHNKMSRPVNNYKCQFNAYFRYPVQFLQGIKGHNVDKSVGSFSI